MARRKKEEAPLEKILQTLDQKVSERGKAAKAEIDLTKEIVELIIAARKHDYPMTKLANDHVKRLDRKTFKLVPVTRQMVDNMVAPAEKRRPSRTTREERRPRAATAERVNVEALQ